MSPGTGPRAILLTGVTGSLGGHLCAEFLTRTPATVYCLARGSGQRITDRLASLGVVAGERAVHTEGDISKPRLGLGPASYDALAETVDEIAHCAAHVNLAAGYDRLSPVNVAGTRNVIALARRAGRLTGRPLPIRYVSTLGVLSAARDAGLAEADERTPATAQTAGPLGYPLTKVRAEHELRTAAAEHGVPLTVFRPGVVTADTRTGRTSASDLMVPLLSACAALGCVPEGAAEVPVDGVDVVARALVELTLHPDSAGQTYHLIHPQPMPLTDVFDAMRRAGYRLETRNPEQWWTAIAENAASPLVLPQAAMRDVARYTMITGPDYRVPRIRADLTWKTLADAGIDRPPLDDEFLDRLVHGLISSGRLPPPPTGTT